MKEIFKIMCLIAAIGCYCVGFYYGVVKGQWAQGAFYLLIAYGSERSGEP